MSRATGGIGDGGTGIGQAGFSRMAKWPPGGRRKAFSNFSSRARLDLPQSLNNSAGITRLVLCHPLSLFSQSLMRIWNDGLSFWRDLIGIHLDHGQIAKDHFVGFRIEGPPPADRLGGVTELDPLAQEAWDTVLNSIVFFQPSLVKEAVDSEDVCP